MANRLGFVATKSDWDSVSCQVIKAVHGASEQRGQPVSSFDVSALETRRQLLDFITIRDLAEFAKRLPDKKLRSSADHSYYCFEFEQGQSATIQYDIQRAVNVRCRVSQRTVEIKYQCLGILAAKADRSQCFVPMPAAANMSIRIGIRINSIDKSILPPGTTIVLRLEMKESLIIASK